MSWRRVVMRGSEAACGTSTDAAADCLVTGATATSSADADVGAELDTSVERDVAAAVSPATGAALEPVLGRRVTTTRATSAAARRCGAPRPGRRGLGTRRKAADTSTPTLTTITAQAPQATASRSSRTRLPSSGRASPCGDSADRSTGSALPRVTSSPGTPTVMTARATTARMARPTAAGARSPLPSCSKGVRQPARCSGRSVVMVMVGCPSRVGSG